MLQVQSITSTRTCSRCQETKPLDGFRPDRRKASGYRSHCKSCLAASASAWREANPGYSRGKTPEAKAKASAAARRWADENRERYRMLIRLARHRFRHAEGKFTAAEWTEVCARYDNRCLACGRDDLDLTIDHIVPLSKGGTNWITNIQPLCMPCNQQKHTRTIDYRPEESIPIMSENSDREQRSRRVGTVAEGDIGPHGAGQWLPLREAEALTGVNFKTLYRQAKRGRRPWRNDEERDLILVWVTDKEHRSTSVPDTEKSEEIGEESQENAEELRSLSVPDAQELFLAMLDRATASLGQQIERLAVERDEARNALEQRSQEHERELQQEQERAATFEQLAAERGRELERERQETARLRSRSLWDYLRGR